MGMWCATVCQNPLLYLYPQNLWPQTCRFSCTCHNPYPKLGPSWGFQAKPSLHITSGIVGIGNIIVSYDTTIGNLSVAVAVPIATNHCADEIKSCLKVLCKVWHLHNASRFFCIGFIEYNKGIIYYGDTEGQVGPVMELAGIMKGCIPVGSIESHTPWYESVKELVSMGNKWRVTIG